MTVSAVARLRTVDGREPSAALRGFVDSWHQRQRKSAGMMAVLFNSIDDLSRAHPEWREYDLLSHVLAALHLIIENDRLTGGHTRNQIVSELTTFVALEAQNDEFDRHREIAEAVVDLLLNKRDRHTRLRDRYLRFGDAGQIEHPEQSFRLVRTVGDDDTLEPALKAEPEAINIFQNLYSFDPADRAAAERYRSERMLERNDYDEVLYSVERRTTSIHGLQLELSQLLRRIRSNVVEIDYAHEVIPKLDEALDLIREQIEAEERFAETVAQHAHHRAPDLPRLQHITDQLQSLVQSLTALHRSASSIKREYEDQQDRQLFTYRRISINPQTDVFEPLLGLTAAQTDTFLAALLAVFAGVKAPRITNLQLMMDKIAPSPRKRAPDGDDDPFTLGTVRDDPGELDAAVTAVVAHAVSSVTAPKSLSELIADLEEMPGAERLDHAQRALLPWMLSVVVASAYGTTDDAEDGARPALVDVGRFVVVRTGLLLDEGPVTGDDLMLVPRFERLADSGEDSWTE